MKIKITTLFIRYLPRRILLHDILIDMNTEHNTRGHKTLQNICDEVCTRTEKISEEFEGGFNFIKGCDKSVTIFGSARTKEDHPDYIHARSLGGRIAQELGYAVLTGGGPGIMEAGNRGASEVGGKSLGLTIQLPHEQHTNPYVTDEFLFHYFFTRKVCMTFASEAYIYYPGGFGTMDELFEILTLIQTKKIPQVPIYLVQSDYWKPLEGFILETLLEQGFVSEGDQDLFVITDETDEIIQGIKDSPVRTEQDM